MLRQKVFSDFTQEEEEKMAAEDQKALQRGLRLHLTHGLIFLLKTAPWFGSSRFDNDAKVHW